MGYSDYTNCAAAADFAWARQLSPEQERFYFLHEMNPRDPSVYICRTMRIAGKLDTAMVRECVLDMVERHDILRAYIPIVDGTPQIWLCDNVDSAIVTVDLSLLAPDERAGRVDELIANEVLTPEPFRMDEGPLFRVTAIKAADAEHVFVFRFHHIIMDGSSVRLFMRDLLETYRGLSEGRRSERQPHQFRDFLEWEVRRLGGAVNDGRRAYWAQKLAKPTVLDLAITKPRPKRHTKKAGTVPLVASAQLRASLGAICRAQQVTPFAVMLAALQILLHKVTGERDVLVGTPIANRPRREFQSMLGVFLNWIAFRGRIGPEMTFTDLLLGFRGDIPEAYVNQCSYESLISAAGDIQRDPSRNPLFQVVLNYVKHEPLPALAGLSVALDSIESHQTHYDLSLRFEEIGDALKLGLTYYQGAMAYEDAERLGAALLSLAEHCLSNPHQKIAEMEIAQLRGIDSIAGIADIADIGGIESTPARWRVAVAATFTAEPLQSTLDYWLQEIGLPADVEFAPLNQVFQELLDPAGVIGRNTCGINVLLIRCEDWKNPTSAVAEFCRLLTARGEHLSTDTIVVACPPSPGQRSDEAASEQARFEREIAAVAESSTRIHFLSWKAVISLYPVDVIDDVESDAYAKAPYSADFNVALGTAIARKIHAAIRPGPKVLVLDCDNTLWRGVVGEDGPEGITIDDGHKALQDFALAQLNAGVLLCLVSKNNEADVWEAFDRAKGMILRKDMFVGHRINWQPKSKNIQSLAQELNLGVDSFVFIDDSPLECAEVRASCPEVLVLQLPSQSGDIEPFTKHLWPLDIRKLTDTDRKRAQMYAANARREQVRSDSADLHEFVASLAVNTTFVPLSKAAIARASQLSRRTNQFNTTTIRRTETEIHALLNEGGELLIADVSDRFGDYGIVGVVVYRDGGSALEVDSLLLSCRALGRGVEQTILSELGRIAAARGCNRVEIAYRRTAKSRPAYQFLEAVAKEHRLADAIDGPVVYRIPVDEAIAATEKIVAISDEDSVEQSTSAPVRRPTGADASHELWREIPRALDAVAKIRARMSKTMRRARSAKRAFAAPRNHREASIAQVWREVLLLDQVGIHDDYFGIGGDSIRSLAIVSKMRALGLPVSVLDVHEHPTIEELAEVIDERSDVGPARPSEIAFASGPYPLSFSQSYLIACYARENLRSDGPPSGAFHIQDRLMVRETLGRHSMAALRRAVDLLIRRTPVLRSRIFRDKGGWKQHEREEYPHALDVVDVSLLDQDAQQAKVDDILCKDRMQPFDPERASSLMMRLYAIVKSDSAFELVVTAHHGFCDGWSLQTFYNHLFALYEAYKQGDEAQIAKIDLSLQANEGAFREIVHYEQQALATEKLGTEKLGTEKLGTEKLGTEKLGTFWQTYVPREGQLSRGEKRTGGRQQTWIEHGDWRLVERATQRARASRTSLKAVFLDAFAAALADVRQPQSPLVIGVITNGRKDDLTRPMEVFGLCWTIVPVVVAAGADTEPQARLEAIHKDLIATEAHARHPIEGMFQGLDPADVVSASFNLTNFHNSHWKEGTRGLDIVKAESFHRFHFPLDFNIRLDERAKTVVFKVNWSDDTVDRDAVRALLRRLSTELAPGERAHSIEEG